VVNRGSSEIGLRGVEVEIAGKKYEPLVDDTVTRKTRGVADLVLPPEPHAEPQNVTVARGQATRVVVLYDSGIR
jgi:hypothetical protein